MKTCDDLKDEFGINVLKEQCDIPEWNKSFEKKYLKYKQKYLKLKYKDVYQK